MRVLVVGAGPTGLTAAVELTRRGIETLVIDKRDALSTFSRAVGITPRSLHLLEPSGVTPRLLEEGMKVRTVKFFHETRLRANISLKVKEVQYGYDFITGLAQDRTEGVLADVLRTQGGEVRYETELAGLVEEGEQVSVRTSEGTLGDFDYVVGADGVGSTTRELLGLEFPGYELPEDWAIADVDAMDWPHLDAFVMCLRDHGKVCVVVPLEPARYRVIANTPDALETLPLELNVSNIRRAGTFRISVRQVEMYRHGRVFLAGDAAHCHSPVGGRGMNLGIADGVELARCIAAGEPDGYGAARHADGAAVIANSERARKLISSPNAITRNLITTGLGVVSKVPFLQRQIAKQMLYA